MAHTSIIVDFVTLTYANTTVFILLALLFFVTLIKYKAKFKAEDLINSFIGWTNRIILFFLFLIFSFSALHSLVYINNESHIISFIEESFRALIYYGFFNYGVFYLLKFINYVKEFVKEVDLFGISYFGKELKGGNNKK